VSRARRAVLILIAVASACGLSERVRAAPYQCPKSLLQINLAVIHGNGMRTEKSDATANLEALRPLVAKRLGQDPYAIAFGLAYNHKEQWSEEMFKIFQERAIMSPTLYMRMLSQLVPMPEDMKDALTHLAAELDLSAFIDDADLEQHVQTYRDHLRKGHKVVVIAHSEGNLYANAAYRRLFETALPTPGQEDFGIVSVALPGPTVAGWQPAACPVVGCYTTLVNDVVVAVVRQRLPDTAPANATAGLDWVRYDWTGHYLRESYLRVKSSREQILDHVASFVSAFGPLTRTIHDAAITASLEWDTTADLDLHVYENDESEHVYYDFPDGKVGVLDADDPDGYGPENYYGECQGLASGTFRFAVGYYDGQGPVRARLRVQAGDITRTFQQTLDMPTQGHSRTSPTTFGFLEVGRLPKPSETSDYVPYSLRLFEEGGMQ
jgi:hypothetical protein